MADPSDGGDAFVPAAPVLECYALVMPDQPALNKQFVYSVPAKLADRVAVGTQVRVDVHGRRMGGWVIDLPDAPPAGVAARPIVAVRGIGPPDSVVDLARWASWRWAGAMTFGLRTASSDRVVANLPPKAPLGSRTPARPARPGDEGSLFADALDAGVAVVRIGPSGDRLGILFAAADLLFTNRHAPDGVTNKHAPDGVTNKHAPDGVTNKHAPDGVGVLVLAPTHAQAEEAARRLRRAGYPVASLPGDWAAARAGDCVVVGTMSAAYAPLGRLCAAVVLDAHDEAYHAEAAPTWCAWEVVAERARRDGAPVALVSPCPTLDVLAAGRLVVTDRVSERRAWPRVEVVDRRGDDPRTGLFSERVVRLVKWAAENREDPAGPSSGAETSSGSERRVVCVLNRIGRARLLACGTCKELARCERCKGPVSQSQSQPSEGRDALVCRRCGLERPYICAECGSARLLVLRQGVSRVREELEALSGTSVAEVWGRPVKRSRPATRSARSALPGDDDAAKLSSTSRVVVGTEAVLHRVERADAVVFLDFDSELMAPRLRAAEEALALLARAARLVSRSSRGAQATPGGPLVVQTRIPDHPAIASAVHADPTILSTEELDVRTTLHLPPSRALAKLSGHAAAAYGDALGASAPDGVAVIGPDSGEWRVLATDHAVLCDLLASVPRPSGRLRVEVDPVRD